MYYIESRFLNALIILERRMIFVSNSISSQLVPIDENYDVHKKGTNVQASN